MNIGMLWFDNDPKAGLSDKVCRAATYYRTKYGKAPNLCFVHPTMLPVDETPDVAEAGVFETQDGKIVTSEGIEIRSNRSVLPNHFWIGVNTP